MKNAAEFETQKDDVFGRIASRYDVLCDLFSLGLHRVWKRRVAQLIAKESWATLLDVASGTGDIVLRMFKQAAISDEQTVIASDISHNMLAIAKERLNRYQKYTQFQILDAHSLASIESSSLDVYSMSLGLKICDREQAINEAYRVLKPGGRIITLEASNIPIHWVHKLYLVYMSLCMPVIGWLATGGDASAYKYLLQGVKDFPSAERLALELEGKGFTDVSFERLSLGIVAIHVARKPNESQK